MTAGEMRDTWGSSYGQVKTGSLHTALSLSEFQLYFLACAPLRNKWRVSRGLLYGRLPKMEVILVTCIGLAVADPM